MEYFRRFQQNIRRTVISWKRVLRLFWQLSPQLVASMLLLTVIEGIFPFGQVQITTHIIQSVSDAIKGGKTPELIHNALFFGIAQALLVILYVLSSTIKQHLSALLQMRINNKISILIMEKAVSLDMQHYEDHTLYDNLQRATREGSYRPYQIFTQMLTLISQTISLLSVLTILLSWNWWLGLLIVFSPFPAVCSHLFFGHKGYIIEQNRTSERRQMGYLQQLVTTAGTFKEIRLFRLSNLFLKQYSMFVEKFYRTDKDLMRRQSLTSFPLSFLSTLIISGSLLYAIVLTITSGSIGMLAGYVQASGIVQQSVQGILFQLSELYQNNLFVSNLFEFLDTPSSQIRGGTRKFPQHLQKGIEFRHVSFYYPGTTLLVLDDLNTFIHAGECVALVGQNGAGKTTIVKLLSRLYEPTAGLILIDEVPIEQYDLEDLRKHVGVIFQDFTRYEMTVNENIGFGNIDELQNYEHIRRSAEESGAEAIVETLPKSYNTVLGRMFEDGHELSLGQWQKIALARAFMSKAPIVILDEPTASIDAEAETEIFGRLRQIAQGATTLLIAHRFSTVCMADRIIVLEHGKVIEDGDHETLLHARGIYAHLFHLQAASYAYKEILEK